MPVECMSGKPAFLAAIAWFAAHLLTNHVSQHPAFFRPPFFRFVEMVVHQLMEDAHGRVAFQLPGNVALCAAAFPLLGRSAPASVRPSPRRSPPRSGAENFPFIGFAELLVAGLQHLQRFTHQLFILIDNPLEASTALA